MRASLILCQCLCLCDVATAQTIESSWENLRQLTPGTKIRVVDMKLKSQKESSAHFRTRRFL